MNHLNMCFVNARTWYLRANVDVVDEKLSEPMMRLAVRHKFKFWQKNRFANSAVVKLIIVACMLAGIFEAKAKDVILMKGVAPRLDDDRKTELNKYRKPGPWKIGMSHFGVDANTWTTQMAHEAEQEAAGNPMISKFVLIDAKLNVGKQSTDIDALIAQKIDALIVTPLTPIAAAAGIKNALAAGIPVIVHTGKTSDDKYTVDIQGGGEHFGKVMGDWLVKQMGGKGQMWILRGIYRHPEDIDRYQGLVNAVKGTDIVLHYGGFGDWTAKGGKRLCEELLVTNPDVKGIWSSGSNMATACIEVLKKRNLPIPPITGESNNGFLKVWRDSKLNAIAPEYGPEQGAAGVRAAVALLEGRVLHKRYVYSPPPVTIADRDKYVRDDLSDDYWFPSAMSESAKDRHYGKSR